MRTTDTQSLNSIDLEQGKDTISYKLKTKLESLKINVTDEFPPQQIAWEILNQTSKEYSTLGNLGDFSLIVGKAKSRKSFFINIAISTAISNDLVLNRFKSN